MTAPAKPFIGDIAIREIPLPAGRMEDGPGESEVDATGRGRSGFINMLSWATES
jgi:hypothetical protein